MVPSTSRARGGPSDRRDGGLDARPDAGLDLESRLLESRLLGVRRRSPRRATPPRLRVGAMVLVIGAVAFACSGEEFDPAGDAELGIREQIQVELRLESVVSCEEPESTAVGTSFRCRAEAEDGTEYDFTAQILDGGVIGTKLDR